MRIKTFGYIMLASAILVTGSLPVVYTFAAGMNPIQLAFLFSLVGTIISFSVMVAKGKQGNLKGILKNRTQLISMVSGGIFVFVIVTIVFAIATHTISAALSAIIYRTWPLMLVAIAPIVFRERITKWDWLAILIGFSGLAVALIGGTPLSLPLYTLPFVGLVLIAAVADALGSAVQKRFNYEIYSSAFVYNLVALIVFAVLAMMTNQFNFSGITTIDVYAILLLGFFQNMLLTVLFVNSMRLLKTAFASNVYLITPFVTMILGYLFLGQAILPVYIFVAASVFIGMLVQKLAPKTSNYLSRTKGGADFRKLPALYDVTSAFVNTDNRIIYDVMKGRGRVLGFYKRGKIDPALYSGLLDSENAKGDGCILLTNKTHGDKFKSGELEYIKEIMGHGQDDTVVIGLGRPEMVEQKLYQIHNRFEGLPAAGA